MKNPKKYAFVHQIDRVMALIKVDDKKVELWLSAELSNDHDNISRHKFSFKSTPTKEEIKDKANELMCVHSI